MDRKFGGRLVFFVLMLSTAIPIWMISRATEFWHFLVTGLFVGVAGGSFTVGISYCVRWFPRERQGLAMGIAFALGKASVFKYISDDYPKNIGVISGVVGLAGGMGGFLMPIMFGALADLTGIRSSAFMLMFGLVWVSLMWMYWTEVRPLAVAQEDKHISGPVDRGTGIIH